MIAVQWLLLLPVAVQASEPAQDFTLASNQGSNLRLSEYAGQVVVLYFWASWCHQCQSQLQALQIMQSQYAHNDMQVLAIAIDQQTAPVTALTNEMALHYPVLFDVGAVTAERYQLADLPVLFLLDRDGMIRQQWSGFASADIEAIQQQVTQVVLE